MRESLLAQVHEAQSAGARLSAICQLLGISPRTVQRWRKQPGQQDRRPLRRDPPANRLSEEEREQVLRLMRAHAHPRLTPRHLVARLADQGLYVASESTMYRLLRSPPPPPLPHARPQARAQPPLQLHVADRPNLIWSWDISRLKGSVRHRAFYLYLVMDVFSRRIMGWHVNDHESSRAAALFIRGTCEAHGIHQRRLLLHSDNGGPMRARRMKAMLDRLGIRPSFSRPRTSSDNAYSEALFRTMKRHPSYPRVFSSLEQARAWMLHFVHWYNRERPHSGISFITPDCRHFGREDELLARRNRLYELAQARRPERWSRGARVWTPAGPSLIRGMRQPA
ncbi:MAG TPA: IS3 family transposase [Cystobacter sp.]